MPSGKHLPLFPWAEWPRPLGAPGEAWTLFSSAEPTVCPGCQPRLREVLQGRQRASFITPPPFTTTPSPSATQASSPAPHQRAGAPRIPPLGIPPGSPDPSPGSQMSGPLSPESLRPFLVPRQRTSGPLGPGAPKAPQCRARRPPPLGRGRAQRRGQPRWGQRPAAQADNGSVPRPRGAATSARSPAAAARTGRGRRPQAAARPARPPALCGRRAAPRPPPPPPHPRPRPSATPPPHRLRRAGGRRAARAGGQRRHAQRPPRPLPPPPPQAGLQHFRPPPPAAGPLKGTRPYCQPAEDELQPESLGPYPEQLLLWKISVGRDARD